MQHHFSPIIGAFLEEQVLAKVVKMVPKREQDVTVSAWGRFEENASQSLLNRTFRVLSAQIPRQPGTVFKGVIAPNTRCCEVNEGDKIINCLASVLSLRVLVCLLFRERIQNWEQ